jgi:hypothetical protein
MEPAIETSLLEAYSRGEITRREIQERTYHRCRASPPAE